MRHVLTSGHQSQCNLSVSTADAECASLESIQGEVVDATQASQAVEGHGKCMQTSSIPPNFGLQMMGVMQMRSKLKYFFKINKYSCLGTFFMIFITVFRIGCDL